MHKYSFRRKTDPYKKKLYYPLKKWMTGVKANLSKLMSSTIKATLEQIGYTTDSFKNLKCEWVFGADGAGSFGQYQGKNIRQNMRNQFGAGLRLISIKETDGSEIFEEKSASPKTVRPYVLINGKESIKLMGKTN